MRQYDSLYHKYDDIWLQIEEAVEQRDLKRLTKLLFWAKRTAQEIADLEIQEEQTIIEA